MGGEGGENLLLRPHSVCRSELGRSLLHEWTLGYREGEKEEVYREKERRGKEVNCSFLISCCFSFFPPPMPLTLTLTLLHHLEQEKKASLLFLSSYESMLNPCSSVQEGNFEMFFKVQRSEETMTLLFPNSSCTVYNMMNGKNIVLLFALQSRQ